MNERPWQIACPSSALRQGPRAVVVDTVELVLFRGDGGRPSAVIDRCPHRGVPLSMGHCRTGQIVCRYHGWTFDGDGVCVAIPSNVGPTSPRGMLTPFAACEQDGYIWVVAWPGSPATPQPAPLPLAGRRWRQTTRVLEAPADRIRDTLAGLDGHGITQDDNGGFWWDEPVGAGRTMPVMVVVVAETEARCRLEVMVGETTAWPFQRGRCRWHADAALPVTLQQVAVAMSDVHRKPG